jgi:hypothetical protein
VEQIHIKHTLYVCLIVIPVVSLLYKLVMWNVNNTQLWRRLLEQGSENGEGVPGAVNVKNKVTATWTRVFRETE